MSRARTFAPLACAGLLIGLAATGCRPTARAAGAANTDTTAVKTDTLTDAAIAGIVITDNTTDSSGGAFAAHRAHNAAVRTFAQRMVHDHGAANAAATALVHRMHMSVEDSKDAQDAREHSQHTMNDLASDSGRTFDRHYIDAEVKSHQDDLDNLDKKLIPHAQNNDLKQLLMRQRATVNSHLQQAKEIQGQLR
ncbi:MAG TPA: DUF4142 domain-containing protein [Gemmatimonadales bacterium]|jgi:putative membrane protein